MSVISFFISFTRIILWKKISVGGVVYVTVLNCAIIPTLFRISVSGTVESHALEYGVGDQQEMVVLIVCVIQSFATMKEIYCS